MKKNRKCKLFASVILLITTLLLNVTVNFNGILLKDPQSRDLIQLGNEAWAEDFDPATGLFPAGAGYGHTLILTCDGTVKAWGRNEYGQLGLGDKTDRSTPTPITGLTGVKQLVAGTYHILALMNDGTVKSWGDNSCGQLGMGDFARRTAPTTISGLGEVKQIAAGTYHTVASMNDGTVKAWGRNNFGQLGLGDFSEASRITPATIPGLTGVKQLAAGVFHTLALMNDGTVKSWGDNSCGQLGMGSTTNISTPTNIPGLTGVKQLAAGNGHTLALMSDGTVKAWGANNIGQLGLGDNGANNYRTTPTTILGLGGVKQIVTNESYTLALMNDGTVKAWGANDNGQLGLGDNTNKVAPTIISGLTGVMQLVVGENFTLALMNDGTVKAWGFNFYMQLGFGDRVDRNIPTTIPGLLYNNRPGLTCVQPSQNGIFSEADTGFIPQVSVSDADNNTLTCEYYMDSEIAARDTKSVSNTTAAQTVSFNPLNIGTLADGSHTIKYEVRDYGIAVPVTSTISFKVDKSAPAIGTVTLTSATTSVTVTGFASDSIAGLNIYPYRYTIGTNQATSWTASTTYTQYNLAPNTQYPAIFEARDTKNHIASKTQYIYTKAEVPSLVLNNPSSYTLDVSLSDNNVPLTQYQLSVNNGMQYITPEGGVTSSPVWYTLTSKKITVKGLNPSTTYSFQAKARNGEGIETTWSTAASGTTKVAPPAAPVNLIATATNNSVTVSWDPVQGALGYDILADGNTVNVGTSTVYTHVNLPAGTPHTYQARARNDGGPGNWSAQISKSTLPASPGIPVNLNAFPQSTSVTVTWSNVPGATGYDIEVDGQLMNNGPNTNYIHSSLVPGTHHTYRVRSINPGGKSEWSTAVDTTTTNESSPVPADLTATPSRNSISLTWDAVNGATGYDIEVDGVTLDNNTRTSYVHTGLAPGSQHIYRVRSKKGGVLSDWSAAVVSITLTDSFGTPSNVRAEANDTSVFLTWDSVSEAIGYDIEADGVVIDNGTDTSAVLNGLQPNSTHTYRIRARSEPGTSDWSQALTVITFAIPAPVNLEASASETAIMVTWESTTSGAVLFELEVDGAVIPGIINTSYTCSGFRPNSQHIFRVRSKGEGLVSAWSVPLVKSTLFNGSASPSDLFTIAKRTSVIIAWQSMNNATSYDVEVDGRLVENIIDMKYTHAGLQPGTQHTYRIRTKNNSAAGDWSPLLTVATLPVGPDVPANVAASSTTTDIFVSWDRTTGADEYDIEVDGVISGNGSGTGYLHRGMTPSTQHTYRVRSKNASGFSAWSSLITISTKSSTMTYTVENAVNEQFNLLFPASYIQELGRYSFTVTYDPDKLELIDLCAATSGIDLAVGNITGTDIQVVQYSPGTVVFKKTGSAQGYQVWSGVVNSIRFRSKLDGQATVTYSFQ